MGQPPWLTPAIDAFVEERYGDCIEILVHQPELDFTGSQLLLISLVRSGHEAFAASVLNHLLLAFPARSLEARLLLFSVGGAVIDFDREMRDADAVSLCRLHFYSGQMVRTFGDDERLFLQAMTAAAQTGADCIERTIAERVGGEAHGEQDFPWLQRLTAIVQGADAMVANDRVSEGVAKSKEALAFALSNLGRVYLVLSDVVGARRYLERSLAMLEKVAGPHHPDTMNVMATLAKFNTSI